MCWRDDVHTNRYCSTCGSRYYGDLGHRGCPGRPERPKQPKPKPWKCDACRTGGRNLEKHKCQGDKKPIEYYDGKRISCVCRCLELCPF